MNFIREGWGGWGVSLGIIPSKSRTGVNVLAGRCVYIIVNPRNFVVTVVACGWEETMTL